MPFHKLLIFYLCITIFCTTSAQNFEAGYIILNSNDTVKGLIRNDGWERSPQTILFRAEGQSDVLSYNPATIKAFFISDILYYSFDADINTKSRSLKDLGYDTSMYFIHDTVFMKTLVRSANGLSLYSYTDAYATERFFVRQDDTINELLLNIFKIYILYNDIKVTRSIYLTQLGNYTRD
ncbi:MAG: hypothetical protein H7Y00_11455, partial [Fimbriimonadaceae bacterium]|nr:hypothetical protein [Chitinophagales bacterium]